MNKEEYIIIFHIYDLLIKFSFIIIINNFNFNLLALISYIKNNFNFPFGSRLNCKSIKSSNHLLLKVKNIYL